MTEPTLTGAVAALLPLLKDLALDYRYIQDDGSPVRIQKAIARVYRLPPALDTELECPCWMNMWSFGQDLRGVSGLAITDYTVTSSLYVDEGPETDLLCDIATRFHDLLIAKLRSNLRLVDSGGVLQATNEMKIQGHDPTLGLLSWNGKSYVGLQYTLSFDQWQSANYG